MARRLFVIALFCAPVTIGAAADAAWKTHRDQNCGIEFKYPASYDVDASGAPDYCDLWIRIGVREARGLRALFSMEIRQMESAEREPLARSGTPVSARSFALHSATARCSADGPDGSTYCTNGEVRSTFKTAQGFRGSEIHLTEVHESFTPKRIEKRPAPPQGATAWIFAKRDGPRHARAA